MADAWEKMVPNHENEALQDNKLKFLADSTDFVNLQNGDFFFKRFPQSFFTVTGFLGCHYARKFTVVFPFATKQYTKILKETEWDFFVSEGSKQWQAMATENPKRCWPQLLNWRKLPRSAHYIFMEKK